MSQIEDSGPESVQDIQTPTRDDQPHEVHALVYHTIEQNRDTNAAGEHDKPLEDGTFSDKVHVTGGVFDGVTYPRDDLGQYQNPSPAAKASEILSTTTQERLHQDLALGITPRQALENAFRAGNEAVAKYNASRNVAVDYLQNDLACAVGILGCIVDNTFHYAYIGDAPGYIQTPDGVRQFTESQTSKMEAFRAQRAKTLGKAEAKREAHRTLRNNPDEECGYGVLNGEPEALDFIEYGAIPLTGDEIIRLTSDGLDCLLQDLDPAHFDKIPQTLINETRQVEQDKRIRSDDKTIVEFVTFQIPHEDPEREARASELETRLDQLLEQFYEVAQEAGVAKQRLEKNGVRVGSGLFDAVSENSIRYPEEQNDRDTLIGKSLQAYDLLLQGMKEADLLPDELLYPCIGGDILPGRHANLTGVAHPLYQAVQSMCEDTVEGKIQNYVGAVTKDNRILLDLSSDDASTELLASLKNHGTVPSGILTKDLTMYLGQEEAESLLRSLISESEQPRMIILFNRDTALRDFLCAEGCTVVEVPKQLREMIEEFQTSLIGSYLENTYAQGEDDFSRQVLFNFPRDAVVLRSP